jgi:hypothetical protein
MEANSVLKLTYFKQKQFLYDLGLVLFRPRSVSWKTWAPWDSLLVRGGDLKAVSSSRTITVNTGNHCLHPL